MVRERERETVEREKCEREWGEIMGRETMGRENGEREWERTRERERGREGERKREDQLCVRHLELPLCKSEMPWLQSCTTASGEHALGQSLLP